MQPIQGLWIESVWEKNGKKEKKELVDSGVLGTGVGAGDDTGGMLKDESMDGKLENGGRLPSRNDEITDKSDKSDKDDFGKDGMVGFGSVVV